MKTLIRIAAPAVLVLLAAGMFSPAEASCGNARGIGPNLNIYTPGGPFPPYNHAVTPDLKGSFWSFNPAPGGGDPALGLGNDNGSTDQYNWLYWPGYPGYATGPFAAHLGGVTGASHWNAVGVDGCIDNDGAIAGTADPAQCMVVLLTDDNDTDNGFFALLSVGPDAGQDYNFATATGGGPINLAPIPKPNITGSVRNGANSVDLTVNVQLPPGPANGLYLTCQQAALSGARYRIYVQDTAPITDPPGGEDSRDLSQWTPSGGPIPVGQPTNVTVTCGGVDREFFLCSTVEFPTGNGNFYEVNNCSRNSTQVECGPNMAQPPARRPGPGKTDTLPRRQR
jgi:hypothetical protein